MFPGTMWYIIGRSWPGRRAVRVSDLTKGGPMVDKKALCDKIRKLYPDIERMKEA
jgi:hypothetical protein